MGLLNFFQRKSAAPSAKPVSDSPDAVTLLRLRARRRLIGAAILVVIGVIGFPLVFETRPRPIPVDLPIEIPRKEGAAALSIPPVPVRSGAGEAQESKPTVAGASTEARAEITEDRHGNPLPAEAGQTGAAPLNPAAASAPAVAAVPVAAVAAAASKPGQEARQLSKPGDKGADKQAEKAAALKAQQEQRQYAEKQAEKLAAERQAKQKAAEREEARVQALLEGRTPAASPAADASSTRVIVQVGAFADPKAAQETRSKVERLGLKTYTQAVDTPDGKRIRVRVGPFSSREEAVKAADKLKSHGLGGHVLTL